MIRAHAFRKWKEAREEIARKKGACACLLCWPRLRPFSVALPIDSLSFSYAANGKSQIQVEKFSE